MGLKWYIIANNNHYHLGGIIMVENNTGYFGQFGGCFVPEQLVAPLKEVEECFFKYIKRHCSKKVCKKNKKK